MILNRMLKRLKYLLVLISVLLFCGCTNDVPNSQDQSSANSIILLIGDGNEFYQLQNYGNPIDENLNLYRSQEIGYSLSPGEKAGVNDQGSLASVLSIGYKTKPKSLGVDERNLAHPNLIELASVKGLSTAVISRSSITNPVSAAFLVHGNHKNDPNSIAMGLLNSPVDILMSCEKGKYNHERDSVKLIEILEKKGYRIYSDFEKKPAYPKFALLNANIKSKGDSYTEVFCSMKMAIKSLKKNNKGFLLIVDLTAPEGGFNNKSSQLNEEDVEGLDRIIGYSYDFCDKNPKSIVIFTPLNKLEPDLNQKYNNNAKAIGKMCLPVFSYGFGTELYGGIYENTAVFEKIVKSLQLSESLIYKENDF